MKRRYKILIGLIILALLAVAFGYWRFMTRDEREPSRLAWNENCAGCHGQELQGDGKAAPLVDTKLKHGDSIDEMMAVIAGGVPGTNMAGWDEKFSPEMIKALALYISERRQKYPTIDESFALKSKDSRVIKSEYHDFRLEQVAKFNSRPYSIAPLPNGNILVTENVRGLSIVDGNGKQGALIKNTPEIWGTLLTLGNSKLNLATVLDVELHPEYAQNGWVYLSHTDRCTWLCGWVVPGTMVRVVRGRIIDGKWTDQQVIWSVHTDHYTPVPDNVAAGRLAFDRRGYLYISIGGKNSYGKLHDLNTPFGKVHRVRDDGTVPKDNPFWKAAKDRPDASTIHTVWSHGHRTGQGLDGHPANGEIWNTEMGPRGGDEINHIMRGGNYGWPLYTNGLDYNGEEVSIGKDLGLDFPIEDTVLPVVDYTPAPAISNFTFHNGDKFPNWESDLLVGTLKAAALYRVRVADGKLVEKETLITDLGRIRDVAMGYDGFVYVVIEQNEVGSLWRIVPI